MGLFCGAIGALIILVAVGVIPGSARDDAPRWVLIATGLVFVFGGAAIVVGYGVAGGMAPDGDLAPGTPFGVRLVQYLLGLGITVSLALVASWIAFGPGPRHFTGIGFFASREVDEMVGRVVFGVGAGLVWLFVVALSVVSFKRLRRG